MVVKRTHYFEDPQFTDSFSPHPHHPFTPAVTEELQGGAPLIDLLAAANGKSLHSESKIAPNQVVTAGALALGALIRDYAADDDLLYQSMNLYMNVLLASHTARRITVANQVSALLADVSDDLLQNFHPHRFLI